MTDSTQKNEKIYLDLINLSVLNSNNNINIKTIDLIPEIDCPSQLKMINCNFYDMEIIFNKLLKQKHIKYSELETIKNLTNINQTKIYQKPTTLIVNSDKIVTVDKKEIMDNSHIYLNEINLDNQESSNITIVKDTIEKDILIYTLNEINKSEYFYWKDSNGILLKYYKNLKNGSDCNSSIFKLLRMYLKFKK